MEEPTRASVEEAASNGNAFAAALLIAWGEVAALQRQLDDRRLTKSVEDAAEYSGIGLNNFREAIRADLYPHVHIGAKEGITRVPVRALDDFLYEQAMNHITHKTTGRNVA